MGYKSRLEYVTKALHMHGIDPTKHLDKFGYAMWTLLVRSAWQGTYTNIYTPLDPNTGQIPPSLLGWEKKVIKHGDNSVNVWFSPNVYLAMLRFFSTKVCHQPSPNVPGPRLPTPDVACQYVINKIPILYVDYSTIVGWMYAGPNQPGDRPLDLQLRDWENGVMLSRIRLPNSNITEEVIREYERKLGIKIPRGYYWVAYQATLMELPGALATADRAVVSITVKDECTKVLGHNIWCPSPTKVLAQTVQELAGYISPLGFVVDTNYQYEYGGHKLTGPAIVKAGDDTYTVLVPIARQGSLFIELIPAVVYGIIILSALVLVYMTVAKWESVQVIYAEANRERAEAYQQYVNFVANMCHDPNNPACQKALDNITIVANASKPSGGSGGAGGGFGDLFGNIEKLILIGAGAFLAVKLLPGLLNRGERR